MNYKEEVLKQFNEAYIATSYDMYQIMGTEYTPIITDSEHSAWKDFYEKYCTKIKTTMKLTREDFEGLEVGTEIKNYVVTYKFNHIEKELVYLVNEFKTVTIVTVDFLNDRDFAIKKPKQYNQGWEVGDYTGKNVWVKVKYAEMTTAVLLKEVTKDSFIDSDNCDWDYAVQLTEINTQNMKVK